MPSSDFRHLTKAGERGKAERLFRAVISAYCALTRPSRRETTQLDDLTLPLIPNVSPEALRFAAATLSECTQVPKGLLQRLCALPVAIAAPLLIRSPMLDDVHLLSLIGRHGLPHARAIARRKDLNPAIAHLIRALERRSPEHASVEPEVLEMPSQSIDAPASKADRKQSVAVENVRLRLRSMMLAKQSSAEGPTSTTNNSETYARLLETALSGNAAFFHTALADALAVDFLTAQSLVAHAHSSLLIVCLRALDLSEEKAFLIATAISPGEFSNSHAILRFLEGYRHLSQVEAVNQIENWKETAFATASNDSRLGSSGSNATRSPHISSDILSA